MIEVRQLRKVYGQKTVLKDLSFTVEPGVITGFVGPNGAGKSTTMKIVAGFESPTSGVALVDGVAYAQSASPTQTLGCCMGAEFLPLSMSGPAFLRYQCRTAGLKGVDVDEVLGFVGLVGVGGKRIGEYSLGMRQRIGIASALLGNPQNLMFDEPINGLDVNGIIWLRDLLRAQADAGKTVFLSSHIMSELEMVADRVIMINDGVVSASGGVEELEEAAGSAGAGVIVKSEDMDALRRLLEDNGLAFESSGPSLVVRGIAARDLGRLVYANGLSLDHLETKRKSLEDLYLSTKGASHE